MNFFEVVKARRSIRKFTSTPVSDDIIQKAIDAAILAPNSSNTQTWNFFLVKSTEKKTKLIEYCLSQSAARTAADLVVITADPTLWKRSQQPLINWVESVNAPQQVKMYYKKLVPMTYRWGFFNSLAFIKILISFFVGLFKPFLRGPHTKSEIQLVSVKSAALAAENFVLALEAQGVSSCMMEGFDEFRVKKLLKLSCTTRVVMVIALGYASENGTWGPQFRLPKSDVFHVV